MSFTVFESLYVTVAAYFIGLVVLGHALLFSAIYKCLREDWAAGRSSNRKPPLSDWPSRVTAKAAPLKAHFGGVASVQLFHSTADLPQSRGRLSNPPSTERRNRMSSAKWSVSLSGLALMLSTLAAHGQQAPNPAGAAPMVAERTNKFTRTCAERDLRLVTLIESHAEAQDIAAERLFEAYLIMIDARRACREGRESEALAVYDSITFVSVPTRAAR